MHCVYFFFFSVGFEEFFTNLSLETIYLSPKLREKWPYLSNYQSKKINSLHDLFYFFIVYTNKNRGGGTLCPPPPIITKENLPLIKIQVQEIRKIFKA